MIDLIKDRLKAEAPFLNNRVQGALEFAKLFQENRLPPHVNAFVVPLALTGARAKDGTGVHSQELSESYGIYLIFNVSDAEGRTVLASLETYLKTVIGALAGWAPKPSTGVFEITKGKLLSMDGGRCVYELVFSISDQLRITP